MAINSLIGNLVDYVGSQWNLPEYGISESIAGGSTMNTNTGSVIGPESNLLPTMANGQVTSSSPGGSYPIAAPRPTSYTSPSPISGGTSGSGSVTGQTNPFNIQPQGVSQAEIDAQFNPIFDVYNQAESNLRGQQPGLIQEAEAQAAASRGLLQGARTGANELLGAQANRVQRVGETQTADQRRILQEMNQANQQRFGGASSAGLAASELQGREFQRSRFGIQQNVQEGIQQIDMERNKVERDYQTGLQQLEVNKQQAVNELNRRFQDKLLEINARRGETESAKQQARLSALQDLRNQAYQINVAKAQFEADLRSQAQANAAQLSQAQQNLLGYTQAGTQAGNAAAGYQATAIPGVSSSARGTASQFTGQISSRPEDMIGQIGSIPYRDYQPTPLR